MTHEESGNGRARQGSFVRIDTDAEHVERDLVALVLTLLELLRELIERQSLRRVEAGKLSDEQIEALGSALWRLDEAMSDLCQRFGIAREELNLDLGPLGTLL
jgi:hypothetical protein